MERHAARVQTLLAETTSGAGAGQGGGGCLSTGAQLQETAADQFPGSAVHAQAGQPVAETWGVEICKTERKQLITFRRCTQLGAPLWLSAGAPCRMAAHVWMIYFNLSEAFPPCLIVQPPPRKAPAVKKTAATKKEKPAVRKAAAAAPEPRITRAKAAAGGGKKSRK